MNIDLDVIRRRIDEKGLKHISLAKRMNMHPTSFSRLVTGKRKFDVEKLAQLLEILDLKFEALLQKAS